jgi:hypothetical protein
MSAGVAASLIVAALAAAYIIIPLLRREAARTEIAAAVSSEAREAQSQYDMLMSSLKDLEDDRATDKIGEEDYRELHARLTGQVVEVMRRLDGLRAQRSKAKEKAQRTIPHPSSTPSGKSA